MLPSALTLTYSTQSNNTDLQELFFTPLPTSDGTELGICGPKTLYSHIDTVEVMIGFNTPIDETAGVV